MYDVLALIWHAKTECRYQKFYINKFWNRLFFKLKINKVEKIKKNPRTEGRKRRGRSGSETSTPTRSSDADGRRLPVEPPMAGSGTATASYSLLGPVVWLTGGPSPQARSRPACLTRVESQIWAHYLLPLPPLIHSTPPQLLPRRGGSSHLHSRRWELANGDSLRPIHRDFSRGRRSTHVFFFLGSCLSVPDECCNGVSWLQLLQQGGMAVGGEEEKPFNFLQILCGASTPPLVCFILLLLCPWMVQSTELLDR